MQLKISNMFILCIKVFFEALFLRSGVFKYEAKLIAAVTEALTVLSSNIQLHFVILSLWVSLYLAS